METVFLYVLNQNAAASWLILAVVLLRLALKKAPKKYCCALWALVGVRLLLPLGLTSRWSLLPSAQLVSPDMLYAKNPTVDTGVSSLNALVNPIVSHSLAADGLTSVNPAQILSFLAGCLWMAGMAAMLLWALVSCLLLCRKTAQAVCLRDNIWLCDRVAAPFIFGIFRPRIILPFDLPESDMTYVLAHERAHLQRGDHIAKPLGFGLLALHWFNPLVWLAYCLFCRDLELSCDERVLLDADTAYRKSYAGALIDCSAPRHMSAYPLAFGEVGVKARVMAALHYKKPTWWVGASALAVCALTAVCFLTSPTGSPLQDASADNACISATVESPGNRYDMTAGASLEYAQEWLSYVRVGRAAVSPDRSESRAAENTLTLYYAKGNPISYHFNRACTQVWVEDGVKPTLTRTVYNPELVRQFFQSRIEAPAGPE